MHFVCLFVCFSVITPFHSTVNRIVEEVEVASSVPSCGQCDFKSVSEKGLRQHKRMKHGLPRPFRGDSNSQATPEKTRRSRSSASLPVSPIVKTNRGDSCQDCENDDCAIHCCDIHKCGGCEMVFSDHNDMGDHNATHVPKYP